MKYGSYTRLNKYKIIMLYISVLSVHITIVFAYLPIYLFHCFTVGTQYMI